MDFTTYVKAFSSAIKTRVLEFEQTTFQPVRSRLLKTANAQFAADGTIYVDTLPTKIESLKIVLDQSPLDSLESLGATIGTVLSPINIVLKLAFAGLCFLTFQHDQMMSVFGLKKSCPCDQLIKPSEENLQPTPPQDNEEKAETPPAETDGNNEDADSVPPNDHDVQEKKDAIPNNAGNGGEGDGAMPPPSNDGNSEEKDGENNDVPPPNNDGNGERKSEENNGVIPTPVEFPNLEERNGQ